MHVCAVSLYLRGKLHRPPPASLRDCRRTSITAQCRAGIHTCTTAKHKDVALNFCFIFSETIGCFFVEAANWEELEKSRQRKGLVWAGQRNNICLCFFVWGDGGGKCSWKLMFRSAWYPLQRSGGWAFSGGSWLLLTLTPTDPITNAYTLDWNTRYTEKASRCACLYLFHYPTVLWICSKAWKCRKKWNTAQVCFQLGWGFSICLNSNEEFRKHINKKLESFEKSRVSYGQWVKGRDGRLFEGHFSCFVTYSKESLSLYRPYSTLF